MKIAIVQGNVRDTDWDYVWEAQDYHYFEVPDEEVAFLQANLHLLDEGRNTSYRLITYVEPGEQYNDVLDKLRKKIAAVQARQKAEEARRRKAAAESAQKKLERKRRQLEKLKKELESNADV